jgi:hypothetical protein
MVDFAWPCGDHPLSFDPFPRRDPAALFLENQTPMPFDAASVDARDISADGRSRNVGQMLFDPFQPLRYFLRRLVVQKVLFHECPQARRVNDFLADLSLVPHPNVVQVLRVPGFVFPSFPLLREFVPDPALGAMECFRDIAERKSFVLQDLDFPPVRIREARPFYAVFIRSFYPPPFKYQRQTAPAWKTQSATPR